MINTDRIVPVTKTDLISLYGLILKQASGNSSLEKLASKDVEGNFKVTANSKVYIANQPVKSLDIDATTSSVSASTIYFLAAKDYVGFSIDGVAETPAAGSVAVDNDASTLYKAVLSSGDITITKEGF